mmetsp:Transcript_130157/g.376561  ORF Transcript_130157/g.376561 Transcript_130157/m.376561 type:complete len:244 (-) Transcript_130157:19-750(-)
MSCFTCCAHPTGPSGDFVPFVASSSPADASSRVIRGDEVEPAPLQTTFLDAGPALLGNARRAKELHGFTAQLQLTKGQGPGAALDITLAQHLRIDRIDPTGAMATYNAGVPEDRRICEGDFVVPATGDSANGRDLFLAMMEGGLVDLEIRRPNVFTVDGIDKSKGLMGLDLCIHPRSSSVFIRHVLRKGLVQDHNTKNPELRVLDGDLIIGVNGQRGTSADLAKILGSSERLELTIARPRELV